jgi:hypothetical protein
MSDDLPTADQLRAYLRATGWTEQPPARAGHLWTKGDRRVGFVYDAKPDEILDIIARVAAVEGRPADAVRDAAMLAGPRPRPRLFRLERDADQSGVSGPGHVADGVVWADGTVTLRWFGAHASTVCWDSLGDAEAVHGHGGDTRFVFSAEPSDDLPVDEARAALRTAAAMIDQGLTESAACGRRISELIARADEIRDFCRNAADSWRPGGDGDA